MSNEATGGWFGRLKSGLSKSSQKITGGITDLLTKRKLDADALQDLEEILITGDLGVATAAKLSASVADRRFEADVSADVVRAALAEDIAEILEPVAKPLQIDASLSPHVVLVCGINGSGKTTTIGKLAKQFKDSGRSVMIAAGDTFRAAAVEQLQIWGERSDCPVITGTPGGDAAALAYTALEQAKAAGADVLMIDTAGRLQNRKDLMAELEKIVRVIGKIDDTAPHSVLLVMDATIGQNAHSQVEIFKDIVNVTGLVMTKLDGSAKGGVVVALAEKFGLPVHAVGVGEGIDDLHAFEADAFARSLMGLDG
ncbi:MAG: signal recognition particle-docking protein FtsY [Rhodospirillaceae bacterium]|nr:signal recognition particle-docking protein FtsY [Rhodospirillaceae bacterium]